MKTTEELVAAIDAVSGDDPEAAHGALDDLLLEQMSVEVRLAAMRLMSRCSWWACA